MTDKPAEKAPEPKKAAEPKKPAPAGPTLSYIAQFKARRAAR